MEANEENDTLPKRMPLGSRERSSFSTCGFIAPSLTTHENSCQKRCRVGAKNKVRDHPILYSHEVLPFAGSLFPVKNGEEDRTSGIMVNHNAPDILATLTPSGCNFFYETGCPGEDAQLSLLPGNCGHYVCQTCMQTLQTRNIKGCPICMPELEKKLRAKCLAARVAMSAP